MSTFILSGLICFVMGVVTGIFLWGWVTKEAMKRISDNEWNKIRAKYSK